MFVTWKGDHSPRHVHVYRDGRLVMKWDLEGSRAIEGRTGVRLRKLIEALIKEGLL